MTLSADGSAAQPPVAVTVRAPALALKPLLAALHQPDYATGNLEVLADLHGAGISPHAIAADAGRQRRSGAGNMAQLTRTCLQKLLGPALAKGQSAEPVGAWWDQQGRMFRLSHGCTARYRPGEDPGAQFLDAVARRRRQRQPGQGDAGAGPASAGPDRRHAASWCRCTISGSLRNPAVSVNAGRARRIEPGRAGRRHRQHQPAWRYCRGAAAGGSRSGQGVSCAGPLAIARGQKPPAQPATAPKAAPPDRRRRPGRSHRTRPIC